jgi:uncharacterized membrane protein YgcG
LLAAATLVVFVPRPAAAQAGETIHDYRVRIEIAPSGDLRITEQIDYDFGATPRHGIFRTIPTRFSWDQTRDRLYPIDVESVTATGGAPADVDVSDEGTSTVIRIGDPDVEIRGRHAYTIVYRVEGALNALPDHDELYWNAIGDEFSVDIANAQVRVDAPGPIDRVTCYQGYQGSAEPCERASIDGQHARFSSGRVLHPFEGLTIVVALPKGVVPEPRPILEERWTPGRAFRVTPATVSASLGVLGLFAALIGWQWRRIGRDRRFVGSPVDQVMGSVTGEEEAIPWDEGRLEAPVEFSPPERLHPAQMGLLLDEEPRTLHVTATIIDLAVRGHLTIEELGGHGIFRKPDWILRQHDRPDDELPRYERLLMEGLFHRGDEVTVSELRNTFATKLQRVKTALLEAAVGQRWFVGSPDRVRIRWLGRGIVLFLLGILLTVGLALWTGWALVGLSVIAGGAILAGVSGTMRARTAKGTALVRRIRGFRRVIATAEAHQARWAEQENVFTRYLPHAIVFGLVDKWAKAFEDMGFAGGTPAWYVGPRPFTYAAFADSVDSFAVTTGGTLTSTPASSGASGFGGGGFSSGGGGGGGGGSW